MAEHALREPEKKEIEVCSFDEFMAEAEPQSKTIRVPGLKKAVVIRAVSLSEHTEIISGATNTLTGKTDDGLFNCLTVIKCMTEPKMTPQQIGELRRKNCGVVNAISKEIWKLSGVGGDAKNA